MKRYNHSRNYASRDLLHRSGRYGSKEAYEHFQNPYDTSSLWRKIDQKLIIYDALGPGTDLLEIRSGLIADRTRAEWCGNFLPCSCSQIIYPPCTI